MKNRYWVSGRTTDGSIFADEIHAESADDAINLFHDRMVALDKRREFTKYKTVEMN